MQEALGPWTKRPPLAKAKEAKASACLMLGICNTIFTFGSLYFKQRSTNAQEFRQNHTHNTRGEGQSNKKIRSSGSTILKKATVKMAEMRMCKHGGVAVNMAPISTSQDTG